MEYLTIKETCEYFGNKISDFTIRKLLRTGQLPHIRMGRKYLIPKDGLRQWIEKQMAQ